MFSLRKDGQKKYHTVCAKGMEERNIFDMLHATDSSQAQLQAHSAPEDLEIPL